MATEYTRRVLIVVPAPDRERAHEEALALDRHGGGRTFELALSATGELPATHYACCAALREATFATVQALVSAAFPGGIVSECGLQSGPAPRLLLSQWGLVPITPPPP